MTAELFIKSRGPIIEIGEAIAERLKFAFPPERFTHEFLPAKLDARQWDKLLRRTPFVGLGFADNEPKLDSSNHFTGAVTWAVFLGTRNESGPRARFYGDKQAPGVLQMMQVAVAALQGHTLKADGVKLGTVYAVRAANAFAEEWKDDAVAMVQLGLSVMTTFTAQDVLGGDDTIPGSIDSTSVHWSFDGGAVTALTEQTTGGA